MKKDWYEIFIENWAQITVMIGAIGFVIKTITFYKLKKREITFSRLQENKILEIKTFYKSYQSLEIALREYLNQTKFGKHSPEIFNRINENIYSKFIDFNYNVMTVKLFLESDDNKTIDEISETLKKIQLDIDKWHIYINSDVPREEWDKLYDIMNEKFPKKLPELIKRIEDSLRKNLNLK